MLLLKAPSQTGVLLTTFHGARTFVSCAELALDPANFCLISARVELKPRLLYGVLSIKAVITVTHS